MDATFLGLGSSAGKSKRIADGADDGQMFGLTT